MKKFYIPSWVKIVSLLVIVILLITFGYAMGVKTISSTGEKPVVSITPSNAPTLTPAQTAEEPWKHFQFNGYSDSRKLGFGIDYPGNWQKPVIKDGLVNTTVYFDDGFNITYGDYYDPYKRKIMSFDEVVSNYSTYHSVTDFTLNGIQGKKLVSNTTADPGGVKYIFPGNYVIHYGLPESDSPNYATYYPIAEKRLDRMIASLYFADENGDVNPIDPETGWHIYRGSDFSFMYPDDWAERSGSSCTNFSTTPGRFTLYVCYRSQDLQSRIQNYHSKYSEQRETTELSRDKMVVDGHEAIKQVLQNFTIDPKSSYYGESFYDIIVYVPIDEANYANSEEKYFEISARGIPQELKDSAFSLFDSILETFKLNF